MTLPLELSARLGYAQNGLDRLAEHRDDAARMEGLRASPLARTVVVAGDIPLLRRAGDGLDALFHLSEAEELGQLRETAFLGIDGDAPVFATLLDARAPDDQGQSALVSIDLRTLAVQGLLP